MSCRASTSRLRRLALQLVLVAIAASPTTALSLTPAPTSRMWVLERTASTPTVLDLEISVHGLGSDPAFSALVGLDSKTPTLIDEISLMLYLNSRGEFVPTAHVGGTSYGCNTLGNPAPPHPCGAYVDAFRFARVQADEAVDPQLPKRLIVASSGVHPQAKLGAATRGWRLVEVSPRMRFARSDKSDSAGVGSADGGVEVFVGAAASGGRSGSIAIAAPPCDRVGVGETTLTGGLEAVDVTCPRAVPAVSLAAAGTEWRLDGLVVGVTGNAYRLVVLDLPIGNAKAPRR